MDEITEKVLTYIAQINKLIDQISRKTEKDPANIYDDRVLVLISRVAHLVNLIINMDPNRFRLFFNRVGPPNRLLSTSEDSQRRIIGSIRDWYTEFKNYIYQFTTEVFYNYIYYGTYDTFSENSRDNVKKANTIAYLARPYSKILEIGPGTGPLLKRIFQRGYGVISIEKDYGMINQLLSECNRMGFSPMVIEGSQASINDLLARHQQGQSVVIHDDFFEYGLGRNTFDLIYIESGIFLFTLRRRSELIFEVDKDISNSQIENGLEKIYQALKQGGLFLIGVQGLMKKIKISDDLFFSMKRKQKSHSAVRELTYYRKRGMFHKKEILHKIKQEKPTMPFNNFVVLARRIGFTQISVSDEKQWVILRR